MGPVVAVPLVGPVVVPSVELVSMVGLVAIVGFVGFGSIVGLGSVLNPVGQPYVVFVSATPNCLGLLETSGHPL